MFNMNYGVFRFHEQKIFLKLNILLKVSILLVAKSFQATETWENSTKDCRTLQKIKKIQNILVLNLFYCLCFVNFVSQ